MSKGILGLICHFKLSNFIASRILRWDSEGWQRQLSLGEWLCDNHTALLTCLDGNSDTWPKEVASTFDGRRLLFFNYVHTTLFSAADHEARHEGSRLELTALVCRFERVVVDAPLIEVEIVDGTGTEGSSEVQRWRLTWFEKLTAFVCIQLADNKGQIVICTRDGWLRWWYSL